MVTELTFGGCFDFIHVRFFTVHIVNSYGEDLKGCCLGDEGGFLKGLDVLVSVEDDCVWKGGVDLFPCIFRRVCQEMENLRSKILLMISSFLWA